MMSTELLTLTEVCKRVRLGKTSVYELMKQGIFPKQVLISAKKVVWVGSEIDAWIEETIARSRRKGAVHE